MRIRFTKIFILFFLFLAPVASMAQAADACSSVFSPDPVFGVRLRTGKVGRPLETHQEPVTADTLRDNPFALALFELAQEGKLLNQGDPQLEKYDLKVDNGGLCGPACITNLALAAEHGRPQTHSKFEVIQDFFKSFTKEDNEGNDPRFGITSRSDVSPVFERMPEFKNTKIWENEEKKDEWGAGRAEADFVEELQTGKSRAILTSIMFISKISPALGGGMGGHFILLLKIDPIKKLVVVCDPNHPQNVYWTPYRMKKDYHDSLELQILLPGYGNRGKLWTNFYSKIVLENE